MRKGMIIAAGVLVLCMGTYVLLQAGTDATTEKTASAMTANQHKENKSPASTPSGSSEEETQPLTFIRDGYKAGNQNGYYCIGDDLEHMKYFDYQSRKEIYLCNKPNCSHDDESCSSYLNHRASFNIFADENFLYLAESDYQVVTVNAGEENEVSLGTSETTVPVIYRMNLDGTDKTKLYECPSGVQLNMPYLKQGNTLYAQFTKCQQIETGPNSSTMVDSEKKLVKINLETGEYKEIADTLNKNLLGAYGNQILWMETIYKQNPDDFINDDQGWRDNLYQSTARISLFDPKTGQETVIIEDTYKNLETTEFDGHNLYVVGEDSQKIEKISIESKERSVFAELPKPGAYMQDIYDQKWQYVYYDPDSDEAKVKSAGYIDLATGENKAFTLIDESGILVEILAQTDTHYFVRTGYKMSKEYTTWAGTKQRDIEETYYGLIRKEDYWNSKAEYLPMETTQN